MIGRSASRHDLGHRGEACFDGGIVDMAVRDDPWFL
jgi:hypothetical protein